MASFKTSGDIMDDVAKELIQLGEDVGGQLGQEMLDTGAEIIESNWCKCIKKHGHVDTGDMYNSVGVVASTKNKKYRDISTLGKDGKGTRNAEKAFVLNYGKSGKNGSHFTDEAEANAEAESAIAMQEILDNYLNEKGI